MDVLSWGDVKVLNTVIVKVQWKQARVRSHKKLALVFRNNKAIGKSTHCTEPTNMHSALWELI